MTLRTDNRNIFSHKSIKLPSLDFADSSSLIAIVLSYSSRKVFTTVVCFSLSSLI